jgi:glycosyltransferase involved in cell wall biosynthesis
MDQDGIEVTVIVPCYEAAATLPACLDSLVHQKSGYSYEILVVENGSTDGTRSIAEEYSRRHPALVRVVEEEKPGAYAARNRGLHEARGRFILFTDADCAPSPDWLPAIVRALQPSEILAAGGEVIPASGQTSLVARYSAGSAILSQGETLGHPRGAYLQTASLGVRRDDALLAGGFDDGFLSSGDADFCLRLANRFPNRQILLVPEALVAHQHRDSVAALFRQYRRYGQGDVSMIRKHGLLLLPAGLKLLLDAVRVLLALPLAVLLAPVSAARRDFLPSAAPLFRAVRVIARRHGQILAWLRPGRLHRS